MGHGLGFLLAIVEELDADAGPPAQLVGRQAPAESASVTSTDRVLATQLEPQGGFEYNLKAVGW
jgi:hypothetical protein